MPTKSLIQDAIARANQDQRAPLAPAPASVISRSAPAAPAPAPAPAPQAPVPHDGLGTSDDDLASLIGGLNTKIKVIGCGGGGCNTIWRLTQSGIDNCELIAANTDAQHLLAIKVPRKILIGRRTTRGLGAGALPQVGEQSALEAEQDIKKLLEGADMVFITAGMGGGTGTGSAPTIAKMAREMGALTIAVVTMPFKVEGAVRMENAEAGLARLRENADTTIVIPNDKLLEIAPRLPLQAAFKLADEILIRSIRGLTEMITKPGLVNLDFADLQTVMRRGGVAMIGLGESDGENRAREAVDEALNSPLLDVDISSASGCLVDVIGGQDMTLAEAQEVVQTIHDRVGPDCRIIWGANVNPHQGRSIKVMVVVTGVKSNQIHGRDERKKLQPNAPPQPPARPQYPTAPAPAPRQPEPLPVQAPPRRMQHDEVEFVI